MAAIKVKKEVAQHFEHFIHDWNYQTYLLIGGYGSGKSYNAALKIVLKLLQEKRKALVVREVFETIRESSYSLLVGIIEELGLGSIVKTYVSPMRIEFPNGSEIIFKGLDKPEKMKSIDDVTLIWIEEASEVKYAGYKELLGRARHPELKIHFILTTNPVSKRNWIFKHFFYDRDNKIIRLDDYKLYKEKVITKNDIYYHHSTVDNNPFLPKSYTETLNEMKEYDPDGYRIAREGKFGTNGTKVLPQFKVMQHEDVMKQVNRLKMKRTGMDFGFAESYNAAVRMAVDRKKQYLYIYWEYYKRGMTDDLVAADDDFITLKNNGDYIRADNAEPKTIRYFQQEGYRMGPAKKLTKLENIKKIKRFKKIICSDDCRNTIAELEDLTFAEDRNGEIIEDEFNIDSHIFDAVKYGLDDYEVSSLKGDEQRRKLARDLRSVL